MDLPDKNISYVVENESNKLNKLIAIILYFNLLFQIIYKGIQTGTMSYSSFLTSSVDIRCLEMFYFLGYIELPKQRSLSPFYLSKKLVNAFIYLNTHAAR